jgi:hypothetical protein
MEGGAGASWRQQCVNGAGPNSHGWDRTAERAISNAATTTRHSRCRTLRERAVSLSAFRSPVTASSMIFSPTSSELMESWSVTQTASKSVILAALAVKR